MDTLVAHYSQPAHEDEGYSTQDEWELCRPTPPLSLQFALPPVDRVRRLSSVVGRASPSENRLCF